MYRFLGSSALEAVFQASHAEISVVVVGKIVDSGCEDSSVECWWRGVLLSMEWVGDSVSRRW